MTLDRNRNVVFANRVDAPFWQGLSEGVVRIQRCKGCAAWIWPAEHRCGDCGSFDLGWEPVDATGTIYSWTRTHYAFVPAFKDLVPYINVLVALPAAGNRRIVGLLLDQVDRVRIGDVVLPDIAAPSERTKNQPALRWRLARKGGH